MSKSSCKATESTLVPFIFPLTSTTHKFLKYISLSYNHVKNFLPYIQNFLYQQLISLLNFFLSFVHLLYYQIFFCHIYTKNSLFPIFVPIFPVYKPIVFSCKFHYTVFKQKLLFLLGFIPSGIRQIFHLT